MPRPKSFTMLALPLVALAMSLGAAIFCPSHRGLYVDPGRPEAAEPLKMAHGG